MSLSCALAVTAGIANLPANQLRYVSWGMINQRPSVIGIITMIIMSLHRLIWRIISSRQRYPLLHAPCLNVTSDRSIKTMGIKKITTTADKIPQTDIDLYLWLWRKWHFWFSAHLYCSRRIVVRNSKNVAGYCNTLIVLRSCKRVEDSCIHYLSSVHLVQLA